MNVKELIEKLGEYPQDMRVVVQGYEDGYDDLTRSQIGSRKIALNTGKHSWEGMHGDAPWPGEEENRDAELVDAVTLYRVSC